MDVATLIQRCAGPAGRSVGDPPELFTAGVAAWTAGPARAADPPPAWAGGRYAGDGHGLSLVLRGRGAFTAADGSRHAVGPGSAVHHLPGRAVNGVLAGPAAELWLAFARPLAARLAPLGLLRRDPCFAVGLAPALLSGFAELHAGLRAAPRPGDGPRLLAMALVWLHDAYARADAADRGDGAIWQERISEACRLLAGDFTAPPDLARIAAALGITPLVLRRRFRQHFGCPPTAWWRRQRLLHAAGLLATRPVAEVARAVGYADPTALAKQVRRHLGRAPGAFRAPGGA